MKSTELAYPAIFQREDKGGFSVSFPHFPEAHTQAETKEEAFQQAVDCLHTAIEWRLEEKEELPVPGRLRRGQMAIPVALDLAPKLALLQIMREQHISNLKLAHKVRVSEVVIRRMLNPKHNSKPEQYARALNALGQIPQVSIMRLDRG